MTAVAAPGWEPIESRLLTAAEAAAEFDVRRERLIQAARRGSIEGFKLGRGMWLLEEASVAAWLPDRSVDLALPADLRLPAGPLLRLVDARGGAAACGVRAHSAEERALLRARRSGTLTPRAADQLAVRVLGLVPGTIWQNLH